MFHTVSQATETTGNKLGIGLTLTQWVSLSSRGQVQGQQKQQQAVNTETNAVSMRIEAPQVLRGRGVGRMP